MWESFLLDWLQQFDVSSLGDLSEFDWTDVTTYSAIAIALGSAIWSSSRSFLKFVWEKVEGPLGFVLSTLVVFSLWYSLLRVHVSVSFNLDKELFDNFLWLSAVSFTPYYLLRYRLLAGVLLVVTRGIELVVDLVVFSWFPEKAEKNRAKWGDRVRRAYQTIQHSLKGFFSTGFRTAQKSPMTSLGLPDSSILATPADSNGSEESDMSGSIV